MSPFAFFMKQNYAAAAAKNPSAKAAQVLPLLAAQFKALSDAQKAPYQKLAEADRLRSGKERAEKKARTRLSAVLCLSTHRPSQSEPPRPS